MLFIEHGVNYCVTWNNRLLLLFSLRVYLRTWLQL